MIHHLQGKGFDPVLGSVDIKDLEKLIDKHPNYTYTFDDRLLSQQLAVDLLDKKGIKGWFFVNHHNVMEQDRMTRERMGDEFYGWFFDNYKVYFLNEAYKSMGNKFLSQYEFYSDTDRFYRFIRDVYAPSSHETIMKPLRQPIELLPLDKIKHHNVGLHSYSHPNRISQLSEVEQFDEYYFNKKWLDVDYGISVISMSHPMGDYSKFTLEALSDLGIKIGFRADAIMVHNRTDLELPRIDIKNLI